MRGVRGVLGVLGLVSGFFFVGSFSWVIIMVWCWVGLAILSLRAHFFAMNHFPLALVLGSGMVQA